MGLTACCRPSSTAAEFGVDPQLHRELRTFFVIVTANPLVLPDKPVAPVDTQRARDLLRATVAAVKGYCLTHVLRSELDADPRADGPSRLWYRVLPRALARAAHHQQVAVPVCQA